MEIKIRRNIEGDIIYMDSHGARTFSGVSAKLDAIIALAKELEAQDPILERLRHKKETK